MKFLVMITIQLKSHIDITNPQIRFHDRCHFIGANQPVLR
jgi:hypothetical protein